MGVDGPEVAMYLLELEWLDIAQPDASRDFELLNEFAAPIYGSIIR